MCCLLETWCALLELWALLCCAAALAHQCRVRLGEGASVLWRRCWWGAAFYLPLLWKVVGGSWVP